MNIYIVRHGETRKDSVFNADGYPDAELTETGVREANLAGKQLSRVQFDAIYSSDLRRAVQTAEIIAGYQKKLLLETDKQIREIHMGVFHTSSEEQIKKDYPEFYNHYLKKDMDFTYPEGESGEEVLIRTLKFMEVVKQRNLSNVCIVCHGGVIRVLISHLLGMPQHKRFNIHPNNCGISLLATDKEDELKVITVNEISHLS